MIIYILIASNIILAICLYKNNKRLKQVEQDNKLTDKWINSAVDQMDWASNYMDYLEDMVFPLYGIDPTPPKQDSRSQHLRVIKGGKDI